MPPAHKDPGFVLDGRLPPETNYGRRNNNSANQVVPTIRQLADIISKLRAEINEKTARIHELEKENAEMKKLDETTAELDNLKKQRLDDREIVAKSMND
uniref:Uncharacterized protein n=1 Tax=Panagrolaimus sp. JU765 TaxID=591449 RepID=A0AC34RQP9_9BILA